MLMMYKFQDIRVLLIGNLCLNKVRANIRLGFQQGRKVPCKIKAKVIKIQMKNNIKVD